MTPPRVPSPGPLRLSVPLSARIETERLVLRPLREGDLRALRGFAVENEEHLRPWSPRPKSQADARSIVELSQRIRAARTLWRGDRSYALAVTLREPGTRAGSGAYIGRVTLGEVVRGYFQSAYLGYLVGASHQGRGLAREAVRAAIEFAFTTLELHRVQAAVMPHNERSLRLIRALGFREEGRARDYLMIDGAWRDHVLFAVTRDEWSTASSPVGRASEPTSRRGARPSSSRSGRSGR
jgi:ribosomal-protein-alanine N-acetyltransferase